MKLTTVVAIALTTALAGCVAPPKEAVRGRALDASRLGLGSVPAPRPNEAWWSAYGDPQLDRIMRNALADNPTLAGALARVREAQSIADAAGARLSPSISFDAKETYQRFSRTDVIPPPYAGGVHAEGHEGLNLSWDLDFWGRQASLLKQARSDAAAAGLDVAGARLALTGAVLRAYIDLDRQYRLVDLAARSVAQRESMLKITRRRVGAGLDTNVELREAEGAVPLAQVEQRRAEAKRDVAMHLLAALSGQGADAYATIGRPRWNMDAALTLPEALPADLLGRRPDVLAALARVRAATAGQAAAKAAFYPDINLSAFAGTAAIGFDNLFKSASATYGVGPAIHLPLFGSGRLKARYRSATAAIDARIASYNQTVLHAVRDAADQLTRIAALGHEIAGQRTALAADESAYRLARERYEAGIANYLTVLSAETAVLATRRSGVDLDAEQARARVALMLAVGGSFDTGSAPSAALAASRPSAFDPE